MDHANFCQLAMLNHSVKYCGDIVHFDFFGKLVFVDKESVAPSTVAKMRILY